MADKPNKMQRDARAQLDIARAWEGRSDGRDNDYAARLRAEARAKDPDLDMVKRAAHYTEIANTVTAETEAYHEKKVRAQRSPRRVVTKPWHKDADPILNGLRTKNPGWKTGRLRRKLQEQWEELKPRRPELPELPESRAIDTHIEKLLKTGNPGGEAK